MGEYLEPSDIIERDGDIISGADYNSEQYNIPPEELIDPFDKAIELSSELVVETPADTRSEAEKRYDAASERVEQHRDRGLDSKAAWYAEDPDGSIRKAFEREEDERQSVINHAGAEAIRQARHNEKVAEIDKILDPVERSHAMDVLLAEERNNER